MNILLLTSCNRIKQVLLSLSLNAQIIQGKFSVIIADNSTTHLSADEMCRIHDWDDPYNVVKPHNYCSDVELLYSASQYFPEIEEFKVIHTTPRLIKQRGESTLIGLGLMQASMMGNRQEDNPKNFCLKLTGTSILKQDILSSLPNILENHSVVTWHRTNIGGYERSTRIFGCRPDEMSQIISRQGWRQWCDDDPAGILEQRFARIISNEIPEKIFYTGHDESGYLLEGGCALPQSTGRQTIQRFIEERSIDTNRTPWLQQFVNGEIW
jgi:hypothetical protein